MRDWFFIRMYWFALVSELFAIGLGLYSAFYVTSLYKYPIISAAFGMLIGGGIIHWFVFKYYINPRIGSVWAWLTNAEVPNKSGTPKDFASQVQAWVANEIGQKDKPSTLKDRLVSFIPSIVNGEVKRLQQEAAGQDWDTFLQQKFSTPNFVERFGRPFVDALLYYNNTVPSYVGDKGLSTKFENIPRWKAIDAFYSAFNRPDTLYYDIWLAAHDRKIGVYKSAEGKFYEWGSPRFYDSLTSGLVFGLLFQPNEEVRVEVPPKLFMQSAWCIAPTGVGKTTLLSSLIKNQLEEVRNGKASIIIMDAKGDLTKIKDAAIFGKGGELEGKLSYIDPWKDLALNPFSIPGGEDEDAVADSIRYLLNSILETGTTELMRPILTRSIMAVRKHPKPSLEVLMDFLADWRKYEEQVKQLPAKHRDYFYKFFDDAEIEKSRKSLHRRLDSFLLASPKMTDMFLAEKTKLDLRHEMDSARVIVINNNRDILKGGTEFFSRFFLMLIYNAVSFRTEYDIPVYFYLDEADLVIGKDPLAAEMMNRCRSKRIGLISAHQNFTQIEDDKVLASLKSSAILIANSREDAHRLQFLFHTPPDALMELKTGEFLLWMYSVPGMPVKVKPHEHEHVKFWNPMPREERDRLEEEMRRRYCYKGQMAVSTAPVDTSPAKWER